MSPSSERELFDQALDLPADTNVGEWLRGQCPGDERLQQRVLALLSSAGAVGHWPAVVPVTLFVREKPGDVIGHWRLEKIIGQGGFGTVWEAEQMEPVRRRVAVKILKAGVDTEAVIARFETERQALAMMDHPGVARVLDAGSTPSGRPFFVMDLLEGAPLLHYAEEKCLPVRARVELARQVAAALQHAHQRGIIHRDLKPSNIVVVEVDGMPVAKVIDFGIARLLTEPAGQQTLAGQQWGTPAWMSPEQLAGQPVDVRTDVFSLGLVLYEMLTGQTPPRAEAAARETSLPLPSRALQRLLPDTLQNVAAARSAVASTLTGLLRGELDWIVQRATAAEPAQRYESAAALRDDLAAFLSGGAVAAGPPSFSYQARKFIRRHRGKLVAGGVAAALLLAGTVVSLFYARRAHAAEASTREALHRSLLTEARALRQTGRPGQRIKALESIAAAARIRPSRQLQDEAVAAMALPDFRVAGEINLPQLPPSALVDYSYSADVLVTAVRTDKALQRHRFRNAAPLPPFALPSWSQDVSQLLVHPDGGSCMVLLDALRDVPLGLGVGMFVMDTACGALRGRIGDVAPDSLEPVYFDHDRRVAVTMSGGGLALCDATTGVVQRRLLENYVIHAVTPDDLRARFLVSVEGSPSAWIVPWDDAARSAAVPLTDTRFCVALSADGRLAVVGGNGVTATFDPGAIASGAHSFVSIRPGHTDATSAAGIAGGGQYVITGGWDELVRLSTPSLEQRLITQGRIHSISPAGNQLVVQNGTVFQLIETVLPEEFPAVSDWVPLAQRNVSFSPDGQWAAISTMTRPATNAGTRIPAAASGIHLVSLPGLTSAMTMGSMQNAAAFDDHSRTVWATGTGLKKWSTVAPHGPGPHRMGEPLTSLLPGMMTKAPVLSSDGSFIAVACQENGLSIRILRTADGSSLLRIPVDAAAGDVENTVFDPNGKWIAATYWRGTGVDVWTVPEGRKIHHLMEGREFLRMSQSADGTVVMVCDRSDIHLWNTADWSLRRTIPIQAAGGGPPHSALSPRGDLIAWEEPGATVQIMKTTADEPHLTLRMPVTGKLYNITFSPDGETLAVSSVQDTWFCDLQKIRAHLTRLGLGGQ